MQFSYCNQYQSDFVLKSNAILQVEFFCVIFKPFFTRIIKLLVYNMCILIFKKLREHVKGSPNLANFL